jgi:hypothetical protein
MAITASRYRDLLWNFVYEASGDQSQVKLRLFANEAEMFENAAQVEERPVTLPWGSLNSLKKSSDWTRERVPSSILQDVGRELWAALPDSARQPLFEASSAQPCRLKISSNSPIINDLPWEWLNDGAGPPFALRPDILLARSVPIRLAIPPLRVEPPVRVLLVITNPKDERLLNPYQEISAVSQRLHEPDYTLRVLDDPMWEALQRALQEEEPHILHYIGHAGLDRGGGNIILLDHHNVTHWISAPELAQALPVTVRLLCLSTCFTAPNYQIMGLPRLAHAAGTYRLPTVVTNCYPLDQFSVSSFWTNFYATLIENGDSNEAFHRAQAEVAVSGNADWGSFSLVIRDQSGEVLHLAAPGLSKRTKFQKAQTKLDIQVQLASRLANDLAAGLATFGDKAAGLQKHLESALTTVSDLTKKLK